MTTLKELINTMFSRNEAKPSEIYVISHAQKAKSGWSFGQAQWDLSKNPTVYQYPDVNTGITEDYKAADMLRDILSTTTANGNRILSDTEVGEIMKQVVLKDGNISSYESRINQALQSDYGKQEINTSYDLYLDYKIERLNTLYTELEGAGRQDVADYIRDNTLMQMMLIDYDNQFYISGVDGSQNDPPKAKLLQYLKTGATTIYGGDVKVAGDFDIADYLKFIFETEYAYNNGAKDLLRRFFNIMEVAKTGLGLGGLLTEEQWKLVNGLLCLKVPTLTGQELLSKIRSLFTTASSTAIPVRRDPLILDLDGDGTETISVDAGAYFDHDANGFAEQTAWAGADDGLLVMDRNGDGTIDNGKEVFGNETILSNGSKASNGFEALKELDDNKDNKIDINDSAFSKLRIWKDTNSDGISTQDELHTMDELGIKSLNTTYTVTNITDPSGNIQTQAATYEKLDGSIGLMGNFLVQRDTGDTRPTETLPVPEGDISTLPDMQGYGNVYDLQQAMIRDESGQLKALVMKFIETTNTDTRNSLMEQILFKWTGSDTISPTSRGGLIDARKLSVLEKFFGQGYVGTTGSSPHANRPLSFLTGALNAEICYAA